MTRSRKPDSSVEKSTSHQSQKSAVLVELTKYSRDRVTERNQRRNKKLYLDLFFVKDPRERTKKREKHFYKKKKSF
ncbi:unnamed protein product [Brassica oleracea]